MRGPVRSTGIPGTVSDAAWKDTTVSMMTHRHPHPPPLSTELSVVKSPALRAMYEASRFKLLLHSTSQQIEVARWLGPVCSVLCVLYQIYWNVACVRSLWHSFECDDVATLSLRRCNVVTFDSDTCRYQVSFPVYLPLYHGHYVEVLMNA